MCVSLQANVTAAGQNGNTASAVLRNETIDCTFDSGLCGWTQSTSDQTDWTLESSGSQGGGGPDADHTSGQGYFLYVKSGFPRRKGDKAILNYQFQEPVDKGCITIFYYMHGFRTGTLALSMSEGKSGNKTDDFAAFQKGSQGYIWKSMSVPIKHKATQISITAVLGNGPAGDMAVDDIKFTKICPDVPACHHPEVPAFSVISSDENLFEVGKNVTYSCTNGQTPVSGDLDITCLPNGTWSGIAPTCLGNANATICGVPPLAANAKLNKTHVAKQPGDTVHQTCMEGYGEEYQSPCTCMGTGRWDKHCQSSVLCKKIPDLPINVTIKSNNPICFELSWRKPRYPKVAATSYQFRCGNSTSLSSSEWETTKSTGFSRCGGSSHHPYQEWQCDVAALNGNIASSVIQTATIRTPCGAPSPPTSVEFGQPTMVMHEGRKKWKLQATWKAPDFINCAGLDKYPYEVQYPNSSSKKIATRTSNITLYADGGKQISVAVWARNNHGFKSASALRTMRPPTLNVPNPPKNVAMTRVSSSCVNITWQASGYLTGFQYRCNRTRWISINDSSIRTVTYCGLYPNAPVVCDVRTVNGHQSYSNSTSAGSTASTESTGSPIPTNCAAPSKPQQIQVSAPYYVNGKWQYFIDWQSPHKINCPSLNPYIVKYSTNSTNKLLYAVPSVSVFVDWNQHVVFSVQAENTAGFKSQPAVMSFDTPKQVNSSVKPADQNHNIVDCPKKDYFEPADPKTGKGQFKLKLSDGNYLQMTLPIGVYPFGIVHTHGSDCVNRSATIYNSSSLPQKRMEFEAKYKVECKEWRNNSLFVETLKSTLKQHISILKELCAETCHMTGQFAWRCDGDLVIVRWLTNRTYNNSVPDVPRMLKASITKRLVAKGIALPIVILNKLPPVVYPIRNEDGSSAAVVLSYFCDTGRTYNQQSKMCQT